MRHRLLLPFLMIIALSGCNLPENPATALNPTPVVSISETSPAETPTLAEATPSLTPPPPPSTPTSTDTPIPLTIPATYFNFPTVTASPTIDPYNISMRISAPAPMSKVVSPIDFIAYLSSDYIGATRVELLGENGRLLFQKSFHTYSTGGYFARVDQKVDFEIHDAAEIGRLQIGTYDEFGRLQAFRSVRVLLLSVGENQFNPPPTPRELVILRTPVKSDTVNSGTLDIEGEISPLNNSPVVAELLDEQGNTLGSSILSLSSANGNYQQFSTSLSFQVNKATNGRLILHQDDDRIPGMAFLYSLKLLLKP